MDKEINIDSPYISKAYYSIFYNRYAREKMAEYKFQGKNYLYKPFGELIYTSIIKNKIENIDLIAYIPSHRRKEAIRGYNQSELLGKYVSERLKLPLLKNNLIKIKKTKDQNKLNKIERFTNLENSFIIKDKEEVTNKKILLVDDIITTGSTMKECSKLLVNAGAKEVVGLALTASKK